MKEESSPYVPLELGTENISTLLRQYAVPAIIAMTASSLYNIVDSIFIGRCVGTLAISGLAVTFPLMNLSAAFGTLVGIGGATMVSVFLGRKWYKPANKVLGNTFSLNVLTGLIFMVVTLLWLDPILRFFGASDDTLPYAREYMTILLYGNIITHLYFGLNGIMRSAGHPRRAMYLTLFTVFVNTILDAVFIYVLEWGIRGAAWATILSQTLAFVVIMVDFSSSKRVLHFTPKSFIPDWRIARDSLAIGFSPFLMNAAACVVTMIINQQLQRYFGDMGIASFGICNRVAFLFIMICIGLNQGMQPIAGYNFGARLYSRVKLVYDRTVGWATVVVTVATLLSLFCPDWIIRVFTQDPVLIADSAHALRIMNCMMFIVGFHIITTNLFQCLGMVRQSIFLSLIRQLIYLVPLLYLLPLWMGGDGIWWSFPISDLMSFVTAMIMRFSLLRKFDRLQDGEDAGILGSKL